MSKKRKIAVIILTALTVALLLSCCTRSDTMKLSDPGHGVITYSYGDIYIWEELYGKDVADVVQIFNGKEQHEDHPSCGFSEEISITIGGYTFALACDSCGVVKNCTTGKYIYISDAEREVLEAMFTSRGAKFPCV